MKQREEQKEKRREEILFAGLELFVKKGYSQTKISDIARAVSMSDGLLFHYFAAKETLYEELVRIGMETSREWLTMNAEHPLAFFESVVEQIFCMIRENPVSALFFVLLAQARRSSAAPPKVVELLAEQDGRFEKTVALIRAGQASEEIRDGNPEALAWAFWCSIQGIAEQLAVHPETPFPKAEWMVALLKSETVGKGQK